MVALIGAAKPLLELKPEATSSEVLYVFCGCCGDPDHGPNTLSPEHGKEPLIDLSHLRKNIKNKVTSMVKG